MDFPTTAGAFDTSHGGSDCDAFVTKLNGSGSALDYSTYLGGTTGDNGQGIAVDRRGSAYVTGLTFSLDFPTAAGGARHGLRRRRRRLRHEAVPP